MKDYYEILEIPKDSSESDIQKAYRKLAKRYHPDVNKSANAHEKFIEISEAYEYLINHTKLYRGKYTTEETTEETYSEYRAKEDYERFRQEAREKAQQQAKMRYEDFKKQNEAFQKSGINDLALLFIMIVRIAVVPFFFFLFLFPFYRAYQDGWVSVFLLFISWPFAGVIAWYYFDKRKSFFKPGKFYYNFQKIRQIYTETTPTNHKCYYCPSKTANSKPYNLNLIKLKDIKVGSSGFRQHNVNFINEDISIVIPRSRKAFIIHSLSTVVKILSILSCLIFLDISSMVWRLIFGMVMGGLICSLIQLSSSTKSRISYLYSLGLIVRVIVWMFFIILVSDFNLYPFNIITSDYIFLVVTCIVLFDCMLMQLVNFILAKYASKPIIKQHTAVEQKFNNGYSIYNDATMISVFFPLYKWIFG